MYSKIFRKKNHTTNLRNMLRLTTRTCSLVLLPSSSLAFDDDGVIERIGGRTLLRSGGEAPEEDSIKDDEGNRTKRTPEQLNGTRINRENEQSNGMRTQKTSAGERLNGTGEDSSWTRRKAEESNGSGEDSNWAMRMDERMNGPMEGSNGMERMSAGEHQAKQGKSKHARITTDERDTTTITYELDSNLVDWDLCSAGLNIMCGAAKDLSKTRAVWFRVNGKSMEVFKADGRVIHASGRFGVICVVDGLWKVVIKGLIDVDWFSSNGGIPENVDFVLFSDDSSIAVVRDATEKWQIWTKYNLGNETLLGVVVVRDVVKVEPMRFVNGRPATVFLCATKVLICQYVGDSLGLHQITIDLKLDNVTSGVCYDFFGCGVSQFAIMHSAQGKEGQSIVSFFTDSGEEMFSVKKIVDADREYATYKARQNIKPAEPAGLQLTKSALAKRIAIGDTDLYRKRISIDQRRVFAQCLEEFATGKKFRWPLDDLDLVNTSDESKHLKDVLKLAIDARSENTNENHEKHVEEIIDAWFHISSSTIIAKCTWPRRYENNRRLMIVTANGCATRKGGFFRDAPELVTTWATIDPLSASCAEDIRLDVVVIWNRTLQEEETRCVGSIFAQRVMLLSRSEFLPLRFVSAASSVALKDKLELKSPIAGDVDFARGVCQSMIVACDLPAEARDLLMPRSVDWDSSMNFARVTLTASNAVLLRAKLHVLKQVSGIQPEIDWTQFANLALSAMDALILECESGGPRMKTDETVALLMTNALFQCGV